MQIFFPVLQLVNGEIAANLTGDATMYAAIETLCCQIVLQIGMEVLELVEVQYIVSANFLAEIFVLQIGGSWDETEVQVRLPPLVLVDDSLDNIFFVVAIFKKIVYALKEALLLIDRKLIWSRDNPSGHGFNIGAIVAV